MTTGGGGTGLAVAVGPGDHVRGPADASVTVVEYGDVECPYCGALEPVLRQLLGRRDDVRLVWRHFPLVTVHPYAYAGALALEAAAATDRFWELHDVLLTHQDALGREDLARYAGDLGLDPAAVTRPASEIYDPRVRADFAGGVAGGIQGTPGLFVGGTRWGGSQTLAALLEAVDRVHR